MTSYHFVGIKGSGMSALAQILYDCGHRVQGSDVEKHFFTQVALEQRGIMILPFDKYNIQPGMTVIAGNAFPDSHEEIARANELGLEIIRYHAFLGDLLTRSTSVAVTGVHGKTTTTGMLAHVLKAAAPTSYLIGDGTGRGEDCADYFVFEACEYRRHFLAYRPNYCIMTNIDFDHPDYYRDLDDVRSAFQEMADQVETAIVACGDDAHLRKLETRVPIYYYGMGFNNQVQARNVVSTELGTTFDVYVNGRIADNLKIPTFGTHSVLNALAVYTICYLEKLEIEAIKSQFSSFPGVKRRFTEKIFGSQILVDDYAHHPTEISATLDSACKKYPNREIVAIFQPHTFTRTQKFLKEFAASLSMANHVYLCDIFGSAREDRGSLSIEDLASQIGGAKVLREAETSQLVQHQDAVLIFMGAGDVHKYQAAYEKLV